MRSIKALCFIAAIASWVSGVAGADLFLQMPHEGRTLEGQVVHWTRQDFYVLGRDGKLWEFDIAKAPSATLVRQGFSSYSQSQLRSSLLREYGASYDVSGTGHFLVVHPAGQRDQWADRFEQLYREMVHYFTSRGISTERPDFPLIAIVFPTRSEFHQHAQQNDMDARGVLGYYCLKSNRIMLYDQSGGRAGGDWREMAATIVHEAAHQTAFNTGIHNRWSNPPRWVCEGLGTLFEARGVNNGQRFPLLADRINRGQLASYRRCFTNRLPAGIIRSLAVSDDIFRQRPAAAYAVSWALTFMLAEQQPRQLAEYLRRTADKPGFFRERPPAERWHDFRQVMGDDVSMLEARLDRFVRDLP